MRGLGRSILAILVGVLVAGLMIAGIEWISAQLYPLPPGLDRGDPEAMREHVRQLPSTAFGLVVLAWAVGTFTGAFLAARIARRSPLLHGLTIGGLFLVAGAVNMLLLPHPAWMWIAGVFAFLGGGYLGGRLGSPGSGPAVT